MSDYWIASCGELFYIRSNLDDEEIEEYIRDEYGDCEWGGLTNITDTREKIIDKVFNCSGCGIPIIRDSEAHNCCKTIDDEKWFCVDCDCETKE